MSMIDSNYPKGFNNGVSIRQLPIDIRLKPSSKVLWVNSIEGSDSNVGTPNHPLATIQTAINKLKDLNGDTMNDGNIIYVADGHIEVVTVAGGLTIDADDVTIIFMGEASSKATISFTTVTTATMLVTGNNVTLINPRFLTGIDALAAPVYVTGNYFRAYNVEWYDVPGKSVTNAFNIDSASTDFVIDGYTYYASTTGTQKVSHIKYGSNANPVLRNIDIRGDFSTANIYNTAAATNQFFENIYLNNLNATPRPGVNQHANTTGIWKNVDIRIVSGVTYVSSLAKVNYDGNCYGYNTDGKGGNPLGGADDNSVEGEINAIQADIGDPSARTNFPSLEAMIGVPDAANSSLDAMIRSGFDSTAIPANANGPLMGQLKAISASLASPQGDFYKTGVCDAGMGASATVIVSDDFIGYGDDVFNLKYYIQIILNANSHGAAPETQIRQITDYVSATGTFTINTLGANAEAGDKFAVIHQSLISGTNPIGTDISTINTNVGDTTGWTGTIKTIKDAIGDIFAVTGYNVPLAAIIPQVAKLDSGALVPAPGVGSLATFIATGGTALGTALADSKSLVDAIGSNGTTLVYGSGSALGAIGTSFWLKKTMTSSAILASSPVDITGVSSGGDLIIDEVIVKTNSTGLAGGTNFNILTNNANGKVIFFSETVANLNGSKTVFIEKASLVSDRTVLESGKKIQVESTVLDCTGVGTIDIYIKCIRQAAGAIVAVL